MSPLSSVVGTRLSSSNATQQGIVRSGLLWWIDANNSISNNNDDDDFFLSLATDGLSANTTYYGSWVNKPDLVTGTPSYWDFDGVDEYGLMNDSDEDTGFDPSLTDAITTEVWMYPDYTGSYDYWIGRYNVSTNSKRSWMMSTYAGDYTGYLWNSSGSYARIVSNEALELGSLGGWQHIVWSFTNNDPDDSSDYRWNYYKNGALDRTYSANSFSTVPYDGSSQNTLVGLVGSTSRAFNGRISIMRQYNRFLSLDEAKRNFNAECALFGRTPV